MHASAGIPIPARMAFVKLTRYIRLYSYEISLILLEYYLEHSADGQVATPNRIICLKGSVPCLILPSSGSARSTRVLFPS